MGCPVELIPHVEQLVLPQVPVEVWVIDSNEHGHLDGPSNTMYFHAHNGKAVHIDGMSYRLAVLVNWGGSSKVFCKSDPKGPSPFPNVFFLAACLGTFEPVYYLTLLGGIVLNLRGHPMGVDGVVTSEMNLHS